MNVALNPDVPEFIPRTFLETITNGLVTMNQAVKFSNTMPIGVAYQKFQSISDFNVVSKQLNQNVVCQLNRIFKIEIPSYTLKENDVRHNVEKIIYANDLILDRISHNVDCLNKGITVSYPPPRNRAPGEAGVSLHAPIVTMIQMGSATFTCAKNIIRPQITFKEAVDNTAAVWVPKIKVKPNRLRPLSLDPQYNNEGDIIGFEHPYSFELSQFTPLNEWVEPDVQEPLFPLPLSETYFNYITTADEIDKLVSHLMDVRELAIDLEHHSYRSYQGFTCLLQITTVAGDFIIDAIATREHLHKLNPVFTNPCILKIFHGADNDVLWLQKDFGVYIVGMFDTHQASKILNHPCKSLSALLSKYCNIDADKSYQQADWRLRPLTANMIKYARIDTHYLAYIFRRMKADLYKAAGGGKDLLLKAFDNSRRVCSQTYRKPVVDSDSHLQIYYRSKKSYNNRQMSALKMLFKWRDEHARIQDESAVFLLPNPMLLLLAEKLPKEVQEINTICDPMPPFVRQNVVEIHKILLSCQELPIEYQSQAAVPVGPASVELHLPEHVVHDVDLGDASKNGTSSNTADSALVPLMVNILKCLKDVNANIDPNNNPGVGCFVKSTKEQTSATKTDWTRYLLTPYERYKIYCAMTAEQEDNEKREEKRGDQLLNGDLLAMFQALNSGEFKKEADAEPEAPLEPLPSTSGASNNLNKRDK